MIKALIGHENQDVKTVYLGLSAKNLQALRKRKPIAFEGKELGLPGLNFVIQGGETEQALMNELQQQVGPARKL